MRNEFEHRFIPLTSLVSGHPLRVVNDVLFLTTQIVNVIYVDSGSDGRQFTLIDAGVPNAADEIINLAERHFGAHARPNALILTHGHFDHVGSILELIEHWGMPVYAHHDELPFLQGKSDYPSADPEAASGLIAKLSPTFPNQGIDLDNHVQALPEDGSVPGMPEWHWIHTPGHTPGHISLFRERDRTLIAGDAITTVQQESLYDVFTQKRELHGPPAYFTTDWQRAWRSVQAIAALEPQAVITGHGLPMYGDELMGVTQAREPISEYGNA
ncbi:MBL fold metallo-hydrolase [Alicyclobacillus sacchari]|uniref:MBL fold metallo-hydrolase n=1 Tax=Alicyclobacillus sacchari TaxID=392010 RepID=UPI0023EA30F3|nr:MBL fold metallo-hydrolase [Alicyclobacillus sacchari]GMA56390.1 MBL fold metallo-hydrolase [Alicyclobacillus sacchari]